MSGKIQLLIRSDDLGYSEAVNHGIHKVLRYGMTRSIGVMTNMPAAQHGFDLIRDLPVCVGQHTNICVGTPVCDPAQVPSLCRADGSFKTSREYRTAPQDFVVFEEAVLEIEGQYRRFQELTGREPDYFEGHAIRSANFIRALEFVAQKHGLKYSGMVMPGQTMPVGTAEVYRLPMNSMDPAYDAVQSIKDAVLTARTDMPNLYVCHPGYVDAELLNTSTLTVNRAKEVAMLCDPAVQNWLEENGVELISYADVGNA